MSDPLQQIERERVELTTCATGVMVWCRYPANVERCLWADRVRGLADLTNDATRFERVAGCFDQQHRQAGGDDR